MFFKPKNNDNVDYFKIRVNNEFYLDFFKNKYSLLIEEILSSKGNLYSEEACGIGTLTKVVIEKDNRLIVTMSDLNTNMIKLTRENIDSEKRLPIMIRDARERHVCDFPKDLIYSSDLLNLLNIEDCERCLNRQRSVAKKVIHHISTPKCWYDTDGKRLVKDSKYWIERLKPNRSISFNDDNDLMLIWEKRV